MGISKSYLKDKFLSTKGYKRNSPDVNNPYNVIPSNQITMKDVDFPIRAISDAGDERIIYPGEEHVFQGNYVTEFPLKNMGNKRFGQKGFQRPMVLEPDYDIYKAPKQGNYLLPDINRPYYTDQYGGKRSEYKIGFNIDGKETLLPSVVGGRQLTPEETVNRYRQTGLHMGQYNTPEEAEYASRRRTAKYNMLQDPVRFNASMFQGGGTRGPIYVSNPNDPRLKRYNDSLSGYNMTKAAEAIFRSNPYNPILEQYNRQGENFIRRTGIKPTRILTASEGDFDYGDVDIDLMQESYLATFKKPVQPVMLDPLADIKTIKSKGLKTTPTNSAPLAPPTSVDIPMRQRPIPYTVKIYDNNAKEFDIKWNPELHQREVIIPMKSPRAKTPAKHTKNYKKTGGTIGIPGVNGQVVSSGPTPLTSVKKTRGPISKDEKGDVKTMSNKQVKKILKNIK